MGSNRHHPEITGPHGKRVPAIGLYIHIPFCEKKCFYCDFYSIENHSQRGRFVDMLLKEIDLSTEGNSDRAVDTIFFGGGTPSLLTPGELEKIVDSIHQHFSVSDIAEFTLECNPGTLDTQYLPEYRRLGVNRISFGIQSFFDDELKFLSRIHTAKEAITAVGDARAAGFENVNIDLMYALPSQSIERVKFNMEMAAKLNPTHISAYALIVEPGTPLFAAVSSGDIKPAEEEDEARMYETVMEFMSAAGYRHYEISNYSLPGFRCRHNLKYWNWEDYAGFGPSAHSHMDGRRWWNVSSLKAYIDRVENGERPVSSEELLSPQQSKDEFIFLHLRQGKLDLAEVRRRFGTIIDGAFVSEIKEAGYCSTAGETIELTNKGFTVCDEIAAELLSSRARSV